MNGMMKLLFTLILYHFCLSDSFVSFLSSRGLSGIHPQHHHALKSLLLHPLINSKLFARVPFLPFLSDEEDDGMSGVPIQVSVKSKFPIEDHRDTRFKESSPSDMELVILGSGAGAPSASRGVSCTVLKTLAGTWLFDCGEGSMLQLKRARVSPSRIRKIFISHTHGDHMFGLPAVLCMLGEAVKSYDTSYEPIDVYGPDGLRDYVRSSLQLSYSRIAVKHRLHELKNIPFLHGRFHKQLQPAPPFGCKPNSDYGEVEGGRDILPDPSFQYSLCEVGGIKVCAAPMQHRVPCVGFVVTEKKPVGRLRTDIVAPMVFRNKAALIEKYNITNPNQILAKIKAMQAGESFSFPDGTVARAEEVLEDVREGRKVVVMSDTCSGSYIKSLAMNADVVVHEATNAWFDERTFSESFNPAHPDAFINPASAAAMARETRVHGHSTPQMAGRFAKEVKAKRLVLTHFSQRYGGDASERSMRVMWEIEDMARSTSNLLEPNQVIAAWDLMSIPIASQKRLLAVPSNSANQTNIQ